MFNAPGANANAVKELVIAGMFLAARNICPAWEYVRGKCELRKAVQKWEGHPNARGEKDHASYRLALRGVADPLDAQFEATAKAVLEPLLACVVDPRLE